MSDQTRTNRVEANQTDGESPLSRRNGQRWWLPLAAYWFQLILQPMIAVIVIVGLVIGFGYAQRLGYFVTADAEQEGPGNQEGDTEYVCPMLCVPPSKQPGRCPVCGMKLKARKVVGDKKDVYGLTIDSASRRLSNIKTVSAASIPLTKKLNALGKIGYDETSEATISAYIDGRLEDLIVSYQGAKVQRGQSLAIIYSPELYSSQVELLTAKKTVDQTKPTSSRIAETNQRLYWASRRRLEEFGIPEGQITELERTGRADSRVKLVSPITGTVVEKLVDEGTYVKTGSPILRVVDLSKVWLLLELFPEDANLLRYGQEVDVVLQSDPARQFQGRVAFIDPIVNEKTQTIRVRVVIPNEAGLIRIGDYARATINVDVSALGVRSEEVYDPNLAGKWISPVHPYIVRDGPGRCPECGVPLVPATEFGFTSQQPSRQGSVVVPRQAVLMSGDESVMYVETKPGRFEFRKVVIGEIVGDQVAIISGIAPGDQVVANATFMVDAAFNMSGKPSLIDPTKAEPRERLDLYQSPRMLAQIQYALASLDEPDRKLAEAQGVCPVAELALGSMGTPIKVQIEGRDVFICCEGCRERLVATPEKYFALLDAKQSDPRSAEESRVIEKALAALSKTDRELARRQRFCPVGESRLGSMGTPIKVEVDGQAIFLCCEGCRKQLAAEPEKYGAIAKQYREKTGPSHDAPDHRSPGTSDAELPQMELPQMDLPEMEPPEMIPQNGSASVEGAAP